MSRPLMQVDNHLEVGEDGRRRGTWASCWVCDKRTCWWQTAFHPMGSPCCSTECLQKRFQEAKLPGYDQLLTFDTEGHPAEDPGDSLFRSASELPCIVCRRPTFWLEINFEAGVCSSFCLGALGARFAAAAGSRSDAEPELPSAVVAVPAQEPVAEAVATLPVAVGADAAPQSPTGPEATAILPATQVGCPCPS